jgi:hypothetical protein
MFKKYRPYIFIFLLLFVALTFFTGRKKHDLVWTKTYRQNDKIPFGARACYQIIDKEFVKESISIKRLPVLQIQDLKTATGVTYFFLGYDLNFKKHEMNKLLAFIERGNKVFIASNYFDGPIADTFHIKTQVEYVPILRNKSKSEIIQKKDYRFSFLNPKLDTSVKYEYDGMLDYAAFTAFDTARFSSIAKDDSSNSVFLRTQLGKGELFLCTLPDVFTNYYIVNHPSRNFAYQCLSYIKNDRFWWDEAYKSSNNLQRNPFRFMIENDSLYYAFWVSIIATLFFMFFGMKRTQRPVPIIKPKENTTLQFVEVVGNVYFNPKNHKVIAEEKILVFFEMLRSKFQILSTHINEDDIIRISKLSSVDIIKIRELIENIQYIYSVETLSEYELIAFNRRMEEFYSKNKR